jgi:hypothetical protein
MRQRYLSDLTTKMRAPCPAKAGHPPKGGLILAHEKNSIIKKSWINPFRGAGGQNNRTEETPII